MHVPLLDLRSQWQSVGPKVLQAVERVLASGAYILGEEVSLLERELAARLSLPHAIGVSSGSDALLVSLMALGIGPGDEVVTTALSFFATAGAIARLGARPVFADIDPRTFNLDPESALAKITPRTRAIVPVHLFGAPADLAPLARTGLPIVEDAAQALDAIGVGRTGRLTTLSFFPSKNLGAAGDAGLVLTADPELADRVRLLRAHGSRPKYVHSQLGGNFRLDTVQAAVLRAKLPFLDDWNRRRRENAARYRQLLAGVPIVLPPDQPGHVWHHFVIRSLRRDELRAHLRAREVDTEVYYPRPLHLQPCFAHLGAHEGDCPHAEQACREVLALPVHAELTEAQLEHVARSIGDFHGL